MDGLIFILFFYIFCFFAARHDSLPDAVHNACYLFGSYYSIYNRDNVKPRSSCTKQQENSQSNWFYSIYNTRDRYIEASSRNAISYTPHVISCVCCIYHGIVLLFRFLLSDSPQSFVTSLSCS